MMDAPHCVLFEYSQAGVKNFHLNQEILVKIFFNRLIVMFGGCFRGKGGTGNRKQGIVRMRLRQIKSDDNYFELSPPLSKHIGG